MSACDEGVPQRCSTAVLGVNVNEVDDEEPTFDVRELEFAVREGGGTPTAPGTFAGNVKRATDPDGRPQPICYFIIGGILRIVIFFNHCTKNTKRSHHNVMY